MGDVPVESTYHGSALLHRLLSDYPDDRLTILETGTPSQPSRRLKDVNYLSHPLDGSRWLKTRFHPFAMVWFSHRAHQASHGSLPLNAIEFDGVLTVAHGFGWLAAASIGRKRDVALHLMVHDDWPRAANVPRGWRNWLDKRFADVYRQAQSRMVVSPAMQRDYETRYGVTAEVLYPSRASGLPVYADPPQRLARNDHQFTIAFAGTINSPGYVKALIALHDALADAGGRLLIFGPLTPEQARDVGLDLPNVVVGGLLSWPELMRRLREEVDALFVPMSFDVSDRSNMEMAFPSKLADCTAVGLPLLIYGPPYCSAVRWAIENAAVAAAVETQEGLAAVVQRWADDPALRQTLGQRALEIGEKYFAHDAVQAVFSRSITSG